MIEDRNSMLYWWPKVKDLDHIHMPRTEIVPLPSLNLDNVKDYSYQGDIDWRKIFEGAETVGFPLFMRTDQASGKHNWSETCFVPTSQRLPIHVLRLIDINVFEGIKPENIRALAFRKYVQMLTGFRAFEGMPINPERRYFVKDGTIICHHPYWPKEAIRQPSTPHWAKILENMNQEIPSEVKLLNAWAIDLGKTLGGSWSLDFCDSVAGWFFIDAAMAKDSYHDPSCIMKKRLE